MKKILGLLLILSSSVFAREITLDQAIQMALENSKEIKISEKDVEVSKLKVGMAFKDALPSVVYNGSYTRGEYERKMYKHGWEDQVDRKGGYTQTITISQPIFQGGAVLGGVKGAQAYKKISNLLYMGERRDIRLETISNYSNIVKLEKDLEALESSHKELKARYEKQKAQLDLRLITKTDILKTEYSMLEVESQIIGTKNSIEIEKEKLRIKTGLVNDRDIKVVEFTVPENLSRNIDFAKDKHQALTESIGALTAKYYVEVADASKMISRADVLPKVNAFASYGTSERTKYNPTIDEAEWRGGVQVTWNVFEFGKNYDSYRVAAITKEQEELREKISKDDIGVNVTDAYLELIRMEKERSSKERAMEAAIENFKMDQERYDAGLISTVDFLLSETQMREAKVAYNQIVIDYLYAFEKYRSMLI